MAMFGIVGGVGFAVGMRWSRYLVYAASISIIIAWLYGVFAAVVAGWPYASLLETAISLLPGLVLIFIACGSSFIAFIQFRIAESDS